MANKGNIGLLFKQKATIPAGQSFEGYFSAPFSENDGSWSTVQPLKKYAPFYNAFDYSIYWINGVSVSLPTTGVPATAEYEHYTWFSNPLKIKSLDYAGRRKWFDEDNWKVFSKFKNFTWWYNTLSQFTFTNIDLSIFPKLEVFYCNDNGSPVGAIFNLSQNFALKKLIVYQSRDYILPDFQLINLIEFTCTNRTLAFVTNPNPNLDFSNKTSLTLLNTSGSTAFGTYNVTNCTNLITLNILSKAVTNVNFVGVNTCINLQDLRFGNNNSANYGSGLDISNMPNLTRLEIYNAGLTNVTFPAFLPSTLSYIDINNNDYSNGWINNLKTTRTTITIIAWANKSKRGNTVVDFSQILANNQINSTINLGTFTTPSQYNVSNLNKILSDLDAKWTSGGSITCFDFYNYQTNVDTFSSGINGIQKWNNLRAKGVNVSNVYNPTSKKITVITTAPNEVVNLTFSLPTAHYENSIDWGDGTQETYTSASSASKSHIFAVAGTYVIETFYGNITTFPAQMSQLDVMCRSLINDLNLTNNSNITTINFIQNYNSTETFTHAVGQTIVTGNTNLTTVTIHANYKMSMNPNNNLDFRNNALNTASIEEILRTIDANIGNVTLRFIKLEGGTNASKATWTANANTYYNSLITKGYTITYNA